MDLIEMKNSLNKLSDADKIKTINEIKLALHEVSPFKDEPVDCVLWVKQEEVHANDYNPNKVAPPEMDLLKLSIEADGYTQPIVTMPDGQGREVIDGFHRSRVGKEFDEIKQRVRGYLPVVTINQERESKNDRMASTIRHNRARGKHNVTSMSDIVIELKKRNWSDSKVSKELGMDPDEVLRLCQVSGLTEVFSDVDFTKAWDAEIFSEDEFSYLDEEDIK
jgi:ParB-like chromosome segregation protein Spo0J